MCTKSEYYTNNFNIFENCIVHDLNNILFHIMGHVDMALMKIEEENEISQHLNNVINAANTAKDMLRSISFFKSQKKIKSGIKIQDIVKDVLKCIEPFTASNIKINHSIDNNCGIVKAGSFQIYQILVNLCTNAFYAMEPEGGILNVSVNELRLSLDGAGNSSTPSYSKPYVKLIVSDTGKGMTQDILKSIFTPYFSTRLAKGGTGLGLHIVMNTVKELNGYLTLSSKENKGTCFNVYLPVIDMK